MRLKAMADHQIPAEMIAKRLRRSEAAIRAEAGKQHVMLAPQQKPLAPTEKLPYGGITQPRRSAARAAAPARPVRSRAERPSQKPQNESLF
jgi:hypothetical protein